MHGIMDDELDRRGLCAKSGGGKDGYEAAWRGQDELQTADQFPDHGLGRTGVYHFLQIRADLWNSARVEGASAGQIHLGKPLGGLEAFQEFLRLWQFCHGYDQYAGALLCENPVWVPHANPVCADAQ